MLTWVATAGWVGGRGWATVVVAAAVFSHFLLDFLVHIPELPLLGEASPKVGLGLWNQMPVASVVGILLVAAVGGWLDRTG